MSVDPSNNAYIHNIFNTVNLDLSNNPRLQFINYLVNVMNESGEMNDNLSLLPRASHYARRQSMPSNIATMNRLLNRTLLEKNCYKKILSENGEKQLTLLKYNATKFETKECVISMEDFNDGDDIIQLPCKHIFQPEAIKTWMKNESSKCPVCRYELKFEEVKENLNSF